MEKVSTREVEVNITITGEQIMGIVAIIIGGIVMIVFLREL